jgi:hypothetical protein
VEKPSPNKKISLESAPRFIHFNADVFIGGRYGRADVAIDTLMNDTYPSFGYMLSQGATTLWEAWEGTHTDQHSSWNHIMVRFFEKR